MAVVEEAFPEAEVAVTRNLSNLLHHSHNRMLHQRRVSHPTRRFTTTLKTTATAGHVLTATTYSKSVLRAVAGMVAEEKNFVDYFPSYEIITHPVFRGMFFAPNMRNVVPEGVETVMRHFFADQERLFGKSESAAPVEDTAGLPGEDIRCEEELLDAFAA